MGHRPRRRRHLMELLEPRQLMSTVTATSATPPSFSVADVTTKEGKAATLTVTLSEPSAQAVTVRYATSDETPYYQAATAGADYAAKRGSLTFRPGETKKTIRVPVKGDKLAESAESFRMNLSQGGSIVAGATVTIQDDDGSSSKGLPVLSIADTSVTEGDTDSLMAVTVSLSRPTDKDVTFRYSYPMTSMTEGVMPLYPADYIPASGTLTIPAGETSTTILISLVGDSTYEPNQTFKIRLSKVKNARPINGRPEVSSAVTVVDDEPVLFTDASGTVVAGFSGVLQSDDVYVSNYTLDNSLSIPVIYSATTLVATNTSTIARFDPQYLTPVGSMFYAIDSSTLLDRNYAASGSVSMTQINSGTLSINSVTTASAVSSSAGTLTFTAPPSINYGSLSGTTYVSGSNLYLGATSVGSGTLVVNAGGTTSLGTLHLASSLFTDANLDGRVDQDDLAIVEQSMADPSTPVSWSTGDFNGDHVINADDLALLDRNLAL